MKSVLLIGNFLSASGRSRGVCEDLAELLPQAGWSVITTSRESRRAARLFDIAHTVWGRRRDYALAQVDLYSGPAFYWAAMACWLLRRLGKPYCVTLHGGNLPAFARRRPRRVAAVLGPAVVVTSPSGYLRDALREWRGDIRLIPNPLEVRRYRRRPADRPLRTLLWLRAFERTYNPALAVETFARLAGDFPDLTLSMIGPDRGDGSLERVREAARRHGLEGRLQLGEAIAKAAVPEVVAQADVFLNTSDVDNTPVSVLEAMACGLCVVSTDVGGMPYLIDDGRSGLLVPPRDPEAMARAVRRVLENPDLAARVADGGRRKAEASDGAVVLGAWNDIFASLVSRAA